MKTKKSAEGNTQIEYLTLGGVVNRRGIGSTIQPISQSKSSDRTKSIGRVCVTKSSQGFILSDGCILLFLAVNSCHSYIYGYLGMVYPKMEDL